MSGAFQTKIRPLFIPFSAYFTRNPDGEIYVSFWRAEKLFRQANRNLKTALPIPDTAACAEGM